MENYRIKLNNMQRSGQNMRTLMHLIHSLELVEFLGLQFFINMSKMNQILRLAKQIFKLKKMYKQ